MKVRVMSVLKQRYVGLITNNEYASPHLHVPKEKKVARTDMKHRIPLIILSTKINFVGVLFEIISNTKIGAWDHGSLHYLRYSEIYDIQRYHRYS